MNENETLLKHLHDIEGLDSISSWPLAMGWWIVICISLAILLFLIRYLIKWIRYRNSWKYDAFKKLNHLSHSLSDETVHTVTIHFSEYLRRIALKRFSRSSCAGLTEQAWLQWLSQQDPNHFDWTKDGQSLINAPYAPSPNLTAEQLKRLIEAAKEWVK